MGRLSARRAAVVGAVAVLGFSVHSGLPQAVRLGQGRAGAQRPGRTDATDAGSVPTLLPLAAPVASARLDSATMLVPVGAAKSRGERETGGAGHHVSQATSFRQIVLPDLLFVAPRGLTKAQITKLNRISGVRNLITFDGARITARSHQVNVIGVNPATFRSWVPLRTASDQGLWSALAAGDFVASSGSGLSLRPGSEYRLVGASPVVIRFGGAADLGLAGIDMVVNQQASARLGLVRRVAGLISAPGVAMATLTRKVSAVLGPAGKIEVLRSQLPVVSVPPGGRPTSYLQLFKASAALYCPGLSWTVLAAIGQIESADGSNVGPSIAGALGPMQFLPSTWAVWGIDGFGETGKPDVMNPYDAVPSAARLLCAAGASAGGQSLRNAIFDYNHANWYVNEVLGLAGEYAADYR
jgi:Transglycosylase SLT domain